MGSYSAKFVLYFGGGGVMDGWVFRRHGRSLVPLRCPPGPKISCWSGMSLGYLVGREYLVV